ncbi:MAG: hypothetical protein LBK02_09375 [Treponema sp.]|jgi:hypothetical protein|nr:hypothetical protein [Treponema sp.]
MKKESGFILLVYLFLCFAGSLYGLGEKTISIGGASAWERIERRIDIAELTWVRPHPVLALSSASAGKSPVEAQILDLAVSFDESRPELFRDAAGNYRIITVSPGDTAGSSMLEAADRRWARAGTGAALFSGYAGASAGAGGGPLIIEPRSRNALFSPDNQIRDFTLEFWLFPLNMANGEQILSWISSRPLPLEEGRAAGTGDREFAFQRILCTAVKNRLQWTFLDVFSVSGASGGVSITLSGDTPVTPKTWSHHLIRFDSDTGLLEYLVNGKIEAIDYASSTRREGGEVYVPIMGEGGSFTLGNRFMGLLDEFRIYGVYIGQPDIQCYAPRGGRIETRAIDLGEGSSGILKVEALGGRTGVSGGRVLNEYAGSGDFRFDDDSAVQFFIRAADSPYRWTGDDWRPFIPGAALPEDFRGRYVQLAADFYPSGDGETSPYLEEIRITYRPNEAPMPPSRVTVLAGDGAVELNWGNSPDADAAGYLVYYGRSRGEYFGEDAGPGASPIDAGKRTSLRIEGLENGVLYYFAVAAYDRREGAGNSGLPGTFHTGEFSREVSARPLRGISARVIQ